MLRFAAHPGVTALRPRSIALLAAAFLAMLLLPTGVVFAAAPDVRLVTPPGISIDGSNDDWDRDLDFLADMFEAGKVDKRVLSKAYARYDCAAEVMYVFVETEPGWIILPSDADNYVKVGQTDKRVDGSSGINGVPPDFGYIGTHGWEASFALEPGSYIGDESGLNIHAEVVPESLRATSAVEQRRLDVIIDCTTPPPTPTQTPTPTPDPTPTQTPTPTPDPTPTQTPTPTPTPTPDPTFGPADPPPIIVVKIGDPGTPDDITDDVLLPGSTFTFYLDDGDAVFQPDGADAPRLHEALSVKGYVIWTPPGPGRYWVVEAAAPDGWDLAEPELVDYLLDPEIQNCFQFNARQTCRPDTEGGYVVVAIADSPLAGVAALTPPPTDIDEVADDARGDSGPAAIALGILAAIAIGNIAVADRRRRRWS